jgi:hypothetical protein
MAERGSAYLTLIALLFGGTLMLGLAVDVARFGATWRDVSHVASTAAEAGAGWINRSAAHAGDLRVAREQAETAATLVLEESGYDAEVTASLHQVCVVVRASVRPTLLAVVGAEPKTITARACAAPRQG